jgi:hypothetical protein
VTLICACCTFARAPEEGAKKEGYDTALVAEFWKAMGEDDIPYAHNTTLLCFVLRGTPAILIVCGLT